MSSILSSLAAGPTDWELLLLNATNVALGLIVASFLLFLVGMTIAEIVSRKRHRPCLAGVDRRFLHATSKAKFMPRRAR